MLTGEDIMAKRFGVNERRIISYFPLGTTFTFKDSQYQVITNACKPLAQTGECKTDIYFCAQNLDTLEQTEFKISYKQANAEFLENKTSAERAEFLLGPNWQELIAQAVITIREQFENRYLIYKDQRGGTKKGSITLGWRFELLKVPSGKLCGDMSLSEEQKIDVYAGTSLPEEKKNATIEGVVINKSGIANYVYEDNGATDAQGVIDGLCTIDEYLGMNPGIYFACKALNYRTIERKIEGDRPLAVHVRWFINGENKLDYELVYNVPLLTKGNSVRDNLKTVLGNLGVQTTDDLDASNVQDISIIYTKEG